MVVSSLEPDRAAELARTVMDALGREYPHRPTGRWRSDEDLVPPRRAHPAFHGAWDWHSAVHGLWALARLLRRVPDLAGAAGARELLAERLTPAAVAAERRVLERDPTFERPYGWAWLLQLATELEAGDEVSGAGALAPLTELVAARAEDWLRARVHPERCGADGNSAFAALLALNHGRATGRDRLARRAESATRSWYGADTDAPVDYEPSAGDFLSPCLTEAHLMSVVLDPPTFAEWWEGFLPGTAQVVPRSLREPPALGDPADPTVVHRHGLALSRAWSWRAVGCGLPPRDLRRTAALDAADAHLATALERVPTGEAAGDHWLPSFALLATGGL